MAIEVLQNEKIFGGKNFWGREKESVLPSVGEELPPRIGGAHTLRNESKEELFSEMLTAT